MGIRLCKYLNYMNENSVTNVKINHEDIYGREESDQHPIYAITGLQAILNSLKDALSQLEISTNNTNLELRQKILDIEKQLEYLADNIDPSKFISSDNGNNLVLGTDNKLMVGNMGGSASSKSMTIDNVTSGMQISIPKPFDSNFESTGAITVWEYKSGDIKEDKILDYTSESKGNYIYDTDNKLKFTDVGVELNMDYNVSFNYKEKLDSEHSLYTTTINLDEFKRFEVI